MSVPVSRNQQNQSWTAIRWSGLKAFFGKRLIVVVATAFLLFCFILFDQQQKEPLIPLSQVNIPVRDLVSSENTPAVSESANLLVQKQGETQTKLHHPPIVEESVKSSHQPEQPAQATAGSSLLLKSMRSSRLKQAQLSGSWHRSDMATRQQTAQLERQSSWVRNQLLSVRMQLTEHRGNRQAAMQGGGQPDHNQINSRELTDKAQLWQQIQMLESRLNSYRRRIQSLRRQTATLSHHRLSNAYALNPARQTLQDSIRRGI